MRQEHPHPSRAAQDRQESRAHGELILVNKRRLRAAILKLRFQRSECGGKP